MYVCCPLLDCKLPNGKNLIFSLIVSPVEHSRVSSIKQLHTIIMYKAKLITKSSKEKYLHYSLLRLLIHISKEMRNLVSLGLLLLAYKHCCLCPGLKLWVNFVSDCLSTLLEPYRKYQAFLLLHLSRLKKGDSFSCSELLVDGFLLCLLIRVALFTLFKKTHPDISSLLWIIVEY